ncbi:MAG: hypothetical protein J3R72DRAFT_505803 [Linnemannia gamsii]|nr:MAG: hypothetical protein J3R72DRAFT_505803 [Linnemannia gamsii]
MSSAFLEAIQDPAVDANGEILAQRVRSLFLLDTGKAAVTLGSATTKQLRRYLSPLPAPDPDPLLNPLSSRPEIGFKSQWRKFWNTKMPHRAAPSGGRTSATFYLVARCGHNVGIIRAAKCEIAESQGADKNHFVFQYTSKYLAWQLTLKDYTGKPT